MGAPAATSANFGPDAPGAVAAPVDMRAMGLAVRIASVLARPIGHLDASVCGLDPLPPSAVRSAAAWPSFAAPLNRALARKLAVADLPIDAGLMQRLQLSSRTRAAALVVTAPRDVLEVAALASAGAVLHRMVVGLVLKAQRGRIREALGETTFEMVIREVPMLYPALGELLLTRTLGTDAIDAEGTDPRASWRRIGFHVLASFLDRVEPALAEVLALRVDEASGLAEREGTIARLQENHVDQLMKLWRRRLREWTDIIG